MIFYYYSNSVFPSKAADSVNVMNTNFELSKLVSSLHVSGISGGGSEKDMFAYYGIESTFSLYRLRRVFIKGSLYLSAIKDVIRILRLKPDVVYGRSIFTARLLHLAKIPFHFECHDAKWQVNKSYETWYQQVFTSPYLLKLVVVSDKLKELTISKYPRFVSHPIRVIRNGAVAPLFVETQSSDSIQIGYVGGFYAGRGLDILIDVASTLPAYSFNLAGGDSGELKILLNLDRLPANVQCLGYISPVETQVFRSKMDILLAPYQLKTKTIGGTDTTEYMSPIKIFEYMSSRTPIVSSDLPVIREILNEQNSILVTADSTEKWVEAIEKLSSNRELASQLSSNAFEFFSHNLTWEARAKSIISFMTEK